MLGFRDIDITDKDRITAALEHSQFMGCEYSFANNMAWKRLGDSQIAFHKASTSAVRSAPKTVYRDFSFPQVRENTKKSSMR